MIVLALKRTFKLHRLVAEEAAETDLAPETGSEAPTQEPAATGLLLAKEAEPVKDEGQPDTAQQTLDSSAIAAPDATPAPSTGKIPGKVWGGFRERE